MDVSVEFAATTPDHHPWFDQFGASHLPALLRERTHVKFRDLGSQRRDLEASEARTLVERMAADLSLVSLPAFANRLGHAAAITGELASAGICFSAAAAGLPDGAARSVAMRNLLLVQLDRRENEAALATLADLARFAPLDMPLPVDRFRIEHPLGLSTFGATYLCRNLASGRRVVVKSPPDSPPGRLSPLHEAELLARAAHPGVPACLEQGFVDPRGKGPYYVIEWFDGLSLHDYIARCGDFSWANFRCIVTPLAETLKALHAQQIITIRDPKPGNVLVRCDHAGWQVKLIDFGIAVLADGPTAEIAPHQPRPFTLGFGAPEQQGQTDQTRLTTAADLYALGRTILFCLCGQHDPPAEQRLVAGRTGFAGCQLSGSRAGLATQRGRTPTATGGVPAPDGPPRFPSTHLTSGTNPVSDPGTEGPSSSDDRSDTRFPPRQPGTGLD